MLRFNKAMLLYSLLAQSHNAIRFGGFLRKNNTIILLLDFDHLPKESAIKADRIPPRRVPFANSCETNDVGITITDHLQCSRHIKQISLQANRTLDFIHRICRDTVTLTPGNSYIVQLFVFLSWNTPVNYGHLILVRTNSY